MGDKVNFQLVSAVGATFNQAVDMVILPGWEGELGILPRHVALMAQLRPGLVQIYQADKIIQQIFIADGFVHINEQACTVLVDEWILYEQLNKQNLEQQLQDTQREIELKDNPLDQQLLVQRQQIIQAQLNVVK